MGTLTQQMRGLAADITSSRDARHAWLSGLRNEVEALRAEIRSGCRERRSWAKSLQADVRKASREIRGDMLGARKAWLEATAPGSRSFTRPAPARRARAASKHGA